MSACNVLLHSCFDIDFLGSFGLCGMAPTAKLTVVLTEQENGGIYGRLCIAGYTRVLD